MKWLGSERALHITSFQCCCHGQGHLLLDHPSSIQPGLQHFQDEASLACLATCASISPPSK